MSVKVTLIGAMHCRGTGRNGPYDFCQVKFMTPLENVSKENRQVVAYGCEESTLDLDPGVIHQFKDFAPGESVMLDVSPNPRNMNRNICTGVSAA